MEFIKSLVNREMVFSNWKTLFRILLILLALLAAVVVITRLDYVRIEAFITDHPGQAIVVAFLSNFLLSLTLLPTIPLTIFLALLLGPIPTILLTTLGNTLASFLHYETGKRLGSRINFEQRRSSLPFGLGKLPIDSPLFLLVSKFIPGDISFVCGAYRLELLLFTWTTLASHSLAAAIVAYTGRGLLQLF